MKNINQYVTEKLKINKNILKVGTKHTLFPESKNELIKMIKEEINRNGNKCSLNHIDVSKITDTSYLFSLSAFNKFNGDISEWNVSNVEDMRCMFHETDFNGDISGWDVSNVEDMSRMFLKSKFNQPLNNWNVSNVENMEGMFQESSFNQNISMWKINPECVTHSMFGNCNIKENFKPKYL